MLTYKYWVLLVLITGLTACADDGEDLRERDATLKALIASQSPDGTLAGMVLPASNDLDAIPADPNNPLTTAKVELGKLLFHEVGLATSPLNPDNALTYSCASCHHADAGFQAGTFQGIGEGGMAFGERGERRLPSTETLDHDVQAVRSPTILNVAFQENMLWNGQFGATGLNVGTEKAWTAGTPKETNDLGYQGVETQAIAGLTVHRMSAEVPSVMNSRYADLFAEAFPDVPEQERFTQESVGLAISAFERTVMANQSPWQKYLRGNDYALKEIEKVGAEVFFSKAECYTCHNGPALNAMEFTAIGMSDMVDCPEPTLKTAVDNVENLGRGGFTGLQEEMFQYKVPTLYNLTDSPFYGHGASFRTVRSVIEYKNAAIPQKPSVSDHLDARFHPLHLTDDEIEALTQFVEHALYDRDLRRFVPSSVLSGLCFPNNDYQSRVDLDCL